MARKAIQGYTEKNYYDNTRYRGIVASTDPLNEGFFKHMVNFDISDTGQSLKPRKGFLTTVLSDDDGIISLSDQTIIFIDNRTQLSVLFDIRAWKAYLVDISVPNIQDKVIPVNKTIANIDTSDLLNVFPNVNNLNSLNTFLSTSLSIYNSSPVEVIIDNNLVTKALVKVVYTLETTEHVLWLEVYYRDKAVIGTGSAGNPNFPADTLVLGYADMSQQPSVYTFERNLASKESIIPETMQAIYITDADDIPDNFVDTFPIIYAKATNNKYLLNFCNSVNFKLIPHFQLEDTEDDNVEWFYTYDVVENNLSSTKEDDKKIYRAPVFHLNDNIKASAYVDLDEELLKETKNYDRLKNVPIITIIPKEPYPVVEDGVEVPAYYKDVDNLSSWSFVNGFLGQIISEPVSGTRSDTVRQIVLGMRAKFSSVYNKNDIVNALNTLSDNYLYYVKTFDETYTTYDERYGSLFLQDSLFGREFLTNIKSGTKYVGGVYTLVENVYGSGAITRDEVISYINNSDISEFLFKFYPVVFPFKYQNRNAISAPETFPTNYLSASGETTFFVYCGWLSGLYTSAPFSAAYIKNTVLSYKALKVSVPDITDSDDDSIFKYTGNLLQADFSDKITEPLKKLYDNGYFSNGVHVIFYLFHTQNAVDSPGESEYIVFSRGKHVASTAFLQNVYIQKTNRPLIFLEERIIEEPEHIEQADQYTVFKENAGDRLVIWKDNHVYISELGDYYYFKEVMHKTYNERIVKVIQFKHILLVFTVQHLYAIYPVETTVTVEDLSKDKGTSEMIVISYNSMPVLYNILTNDKYKDAIQVFNQMVLFYSADGQMFMIKPSATIDSDTRFSLQYFNKSANDILLNYTDYINDRLKVYGVDRVVEASEVKIKVLISINYIKTFYTVEGLITYVLIYDVLNNYYYVQDTLSFYNLKNLMYVEGGEVYTTVVNDKLYLTFPFAEQNAVDNNVDSSFLDNFSEQPIHAEIDTGIFNLNNHLWKRFRDLYVTYKNLNATELEFMLDTFLDDVVVQTYLNTVLEVRDIGGQRTFINTVDKNKVELVNNEHALFDFSDYQSNKLLTHKGQILGLGKAFRMKMQFISKGSYKIQDFGIVYKERRV